MSWQTNATPTARLHFSERNALVLALHVLRDLAFSHPSVQNFPLLDAQGSAVPVQFLKTLRNGDGGIRQTRIAFLARDIPALGYAIYRAVPNRLSAPSTGTTTQSSMHEDQAEMENEFYRASFNLWTGEMNSLTLKQNNW